MESFLTGAICCLGFLQFEKQNQNKVKKTNTQTNKQTNKQTK